MTVYLAAYTLLFLLLIYFALAWSGVVPRPRPTQNTPTAAQGAVLGLALLLSAAGLAAAALWSAAPRRAWLWPVAALPPVIFFLPALGEMVGLLSAPPSALIFAFALLGVIGVPALVVAAAVAALQARAAAGSRAGP